MRGKDARLIARVDFLVGQRRRKRDIRAPFAAVLSLTRVRNDRIYRVGARVVMVDGRRRTLVQSVRMCARPSRGEDAD